VSEPDEALARAREAAAAKRRRGGYAAADAGVDDLDSTILGEKAPATLLSEWAVIEIEPGLLYSTRRGGAPVTGLKRLLMRLLRQYFVELEARQTRFNLGILAAISELEQRMNRLERESDPRTEPE
jgi:hypothetical protein